MGHLLENQTHSGMVTLHTPLHPRYAHIIRQAIVDICGYAGMSEFKTAQLEMAADEATSLIFAAQDRTVHDGPEIPEQQNELAVRLYQQNEGVVVDLCHGGDPLEMGESANPQNWFGDENPEAAGLFVIRRSVDELSYRRGTPYGHCLRMEKKK